MKESAKTGGYANRLKHILVTATVLFTLGGLLSPVHADPSNTFFGGPGGDHPLRVVPNAYYYPYDNHYYYPRTYVPTYTAPPPPPPTYLDSESGNYCRQFSRQIRTGNQVWESYGTACLQDDGSWRVVDQQ